jgi:putative oxidoreductase
MRESLILVRALEVLLGGLFVYAGLVKCLHPFEFAEAVLAYRLLPESLVGAAAAVLPWVEMAAGLLLVTGLKRRSALLLLAALLGGFLAVILITLGRGLKIDCGCGLFFQRQVGPAVVLEDAGFLLWAGGLYWWELLRSKRVGGMSAAEASS